MAGWAALSPVSSRLAYAGVAEVSIYLASWARGQGMGKALLGELITASEQGGVWTLQATIFAVNTASLALHQSCGFRLVGRRERIAQRAGVWQDTIILERRSSQTGC
jgi:L-amino acid N-acyltransferase YncA